MEKIDYQDFLKIAKRFDWTEGSLFEQVDKFMALMRDKYGCIIIREKAPGSLTRQYEEPLEVFGMRVPNGVKLDFIVGIDDRKDSEGDLFMIENNLNTANIVDYFNASDATKYVHASEFFQHLRLH